jgi:hypothetical protein
MMTKLLFALAVVLVCETLGAAPTTTTTTTPSATEAPPPIAARPFVWPQWLRDAINRVTTNPFIWPN